MRMSLLRFFMLLSLAAWVGGIICFAFVVAPTLFSVLPARNLAGLVVSRSLTLLHSMGVVCGAAFLVLSLLEAHGATGNWRVLAARNLLVLGMVALTLGSQTMVAAKMAALRVQMGDIDLVPADDARRVAFNQLHQWSTRLETMVLLLGLAVLYLLARQWGPAPTTGRSLPS